jgi:hypothetical protein
MEALYKLGVGDVIPFDGDYIMSSGLQRLRPRDPTVPDLISKRDWSKNFAPVVVHVGIDGNRKNFASHKFGEHGLRTCQIPALPYIKIYASPQRE